MACSVISCERLEVLRTAMSLLSPISDSFWKLKEPFLNKKKSQSQAARELGIDPKTFRN